MATKVADIAEYLAARQRVYSEALAGDVRRLTKKFGEEPVRDAQALIEKRAADPDPDQYQWNRDAHRQAVTAGLQRVLIARAMGDLPDADE